MRRDGGASGHPACLVLLWVDRVGDTIHLLYLLCFSTMVKPYLL